MKNLPSNLHILISRTDNIGDVILTLPIAYALKQHFPHCSITFLARDYVKAIVDACPAIDTFLSWDELQKQSSEAAIQAIKNSQINVAIHVFPRKEIAALMVKAHIPWRIGTYHRWYHYFYCNRLVRLNRKNSQLHEAQLNLKLLKPLGIVEAYPLETLKQLIKLSPKAIPLPEKIHNMIDPKRFNLIIHPFSNNNSKEWPLDYYETLITSLPVNQFNIFVTGSEDEKKLLTSLSHKNASAHIVCGELSLNELIELMRQCNGLLAGSTGPLHMAAALGLSTLGLYPPPQTMNPARWAPIGPHAQFLVTDSSCVQYCRQPEGRTCACMKMLSVEQVKTVLLSWITS